jgi:hypothetical protein
MRLRARLKTHGRKLIAEASRVYENNPGALHLRGMNMLYEAMRDKGSMVIVPSSAIDSMGLGGTLATAAVAKLQP